MFHLIRNTILLVAVTLFTHPGFAQTDADPSTVELIEAGDEPRRQLRYKPEIGKEQSLRLRRTGSTEQKMGEGMQMEMDLPEAAVTYTFIPTSTSEEGITEFKYGFADIKLTSTDPKLAMHVKQMQQMVDPYAGKSAPAKIDARGFVVQSPQVGEGLQAAQINQSMGRFTDIRMLLPAEKVGPGAKWKVIETLDQGGVKITVESVVTLLSADGNLITIAHKSSGGAESQMVPTGNPAIGDAELLNLKVDGTGSLTIDLTQVAPSKVAYTSDMSMSIKMKIPTQQGQPPQPPMTMIQNARQQVETIPLKSAAQ